MFVQTLQEQFYEFYLMSDNKSINRLFSRLRSQIDSNISIENFKRQYFTKFLKEINYMVKNEDLNHRDFDFEELKKRKLWKPLAKIILLKRIEELKNAQVEKKGKKYYVKDLKKTYFGRYIMDRLKFSRRTVLDEKEYEKVVAAIKKLNYEIPIVVQPTETELFFEE